MTYKIILFAMSASLMFLNSAKADGGSISGGNVELYPLMICQASSVDPTFPSTIKKLTVAGERTYSGQLQQKLSVTVVLLDRFNKPLRYLPTSTLPAQFNGNLEIKRYPQASSGSPNPTIGLLKLNTYNPSQGVLVSVGNDRSIPELALSSCAFSPSFKK